MRIVHSVAELRAALADSNAAAFVPTMGNLHEGHIDLVRQARQVGRPVVASVFVNPLQFGQGEDFERYPRTLAADAEKLEAAGCDLLFAPDVAEMYPVPQTYQVMPPLADELCGAYRPGHFAGVCTVVLKLFAMVSPRYAVFGKKDYQQLFILKGMAQQFNLPVEIIAGETIRADDGLALSSRNGYLSIEERKEAPRLNRELSQIRDAITAGGRNFAALESTATTHLTQAGWRVDYISVRSQTTLLAPDADEHTLVVLGAAWLNKTRLIDNLEIA
jgi:pantoate--beta-alanine ligase